MKLVYFLIFISFNSFAQKVYYFNAFSNYESKRENSDFTSTKPIYLNNKSGDYWLRFYKKNENIEGELFDYAEQKLHYFLVRIEGDNYHFDYQISKSMIGRFPNYRKYSFEQETDGDKTVLKIFKNKKKKKLIQKYDLITKESSENWFLPCKFSAMHPMEAWLALNLNRNIEVTEIRYPLEKTFCIIKLIELRKVNFSVSIPKKLNY